MSNFFSFMGRMKYIERWSLMRNTIKENIMEHSEQVATIAHALAIISNKIFNGNVNADRVAVIGMYHEASEVITGDLPTPIKYYNPIIKDAYKALEQIATEKLINMIPPELQSEYSQIIEPDTTTIEYKLMKAADKLSAYIKCIEELKSGNKEFVKAEVSIRKELEKSPLPEVKYFMDNFIDAFKKTLDELD